jgi:hypothetical protein
MKPNSHASGAAVLYVRISSEEQLRKSATNIDTQIKKCVDACANLSIEPVKTFTDKGESAYKQAASERPALQAMLAYLRENRKKITHGHHRSEQAGPENRRSSNVAGWVQEGRADVRLRG